MTTSEPLPFFTLEDSVELDTNQNWKDYNPSFLLDINAAYQGSPSSPQSCDSSSVSGTDDNGGATPVSPATSTSMSATAAASAAPAPGVSFAVMNAAGTTPAVLPLSAYFPLSDAKFIKAEPALSESHPAANGAPLNAPVIPIGPVAVLPTLPPISSGAVDVDTIRELLKEQDVKKQRLARKAELARMSRKRKKLRMNDLEDEVDRLKEELERAHKKLKVTEEKLVEVQAHAPVQAPPPAVAPPVSVQEEAKQVYSAMRFAAARRSEDDLKQMSALASAAVNLIKKRNAAAQAHLAGMKEHTELALPLRFLEWAMGKSDNFFTDPSGLWSSLFNREIGLSQQQLERLMALRKQNQAQPTTADVEMAFAEFQKRMEGNMQNAETYLAAVTEILSPEQLVKFFGWVDQFGPVCVKINL